MSTRHSRFDTKIAVKRKFDNTIKIIKNPMILGKIELNNLPN